MNAIKSVPNPLSSRFSYEPSGAGPVDQVAASLGRPAPLRKGMKLAGSEVENIDEARAGRGVFKGD